MKNNNKNNLVPLILAFIHYFTWVTGFFAYLYCLKPKKINKPEFMLIIFFIVQILVQTLNNVEFIYILMDFRFYWFWALFLRIANDEIVSSTFKKIFIFFCILTIIESLLINFIISPNLLPNFYQYPISEDNRAGYYYQRPNSLGGSSSVASVILVTFFSIIEMNTLMYLIGILTLILFASGTGFSIFIVHILLESIKRNFFLKGLIYISILSLPVIFIDIQGLELFFSKMSPEYFNEMIDFKYKQIGQLYNITSVEFIFGKMGIYRGGDFGLFAFFYANGIIGTLLLFYFIIKNINKTNYIPISLLFLGTIHYPTIFFLPGQVLFGYLLGMKRISK